MFFKGTDPSGLASTLAAESEEVEHVIGHTGESVYDEPALEVVPPYQFRVRYHLLHRPHVRRVEIQ